MTYREWNMEMQRAIDAAWNTKNPDAIAFQNRYFPEGKPTVELFLKRMTEYARCRCKMNNIKS